MSDYQSIEFKVIDRCATISLNMPPLNVLNITAMREIVDALDRVYAMDDIICLIFRANGKAFSAGVDIKDHTADKAEEMIHVFHAIFRKMLDIELPIIAAVEGAALGGGCELATFCDFIVATPRAKFGQPEIKVGVYPPIAALIFPKIFGFSKGMELVLSGDIIDGKTAQELGLINVLAEPENFQTALQEFVKKITPTSPIILKHTKRAIQAADKKKFLAELKAVEYIYLNSLMKTEDAHEGLAAFMEKRKPDFKGL